MVEKSSINPFIKLTLDLGPLVLFFAVNARWGIFTGTAAFMAAIVAALAISYALTKRMPVMTVVSAFVVLLFGGLTLTLHDDTFIKLKPTIIYMLFAIVLSVGLITGRPLLALVFETAFHLTEQGWRKLTIRWIGFFLVLAMLNEIIWRTQSTDLWIDFKVFGVLPLTLLFGALQYPLITKYHADAPTPPHE